MFDVEWVHIIVYFVLLPGLIAILLIDKTWKSFYSSIIHVVKANNKGKISISKIILSGFFMKNQFILGIFIITILLSLLVVNIFEKNEVLPIVSIIIGYLLGRNFKEMDFGVPKKGDDKKNEKI
ncbi:MAG: hypothetical protein NTU76_01030 [Candidatus Taylorbacteria bacterium]|nr:hypothetical protein [Candidatus Taylorbacteria bacterium]